MIPNMYLLILIVIHFHLQRNTITCTELEILFCIINLLSEVFPFPVRSYCQMLTAVKF